MKLVYLAGPYTAENDWLVFMNVVTARVWAEDVMRRGYAVYSPHAQNFASSMSWDDIMDRDIEVLSRCDMLVMLPGWEESRGSQMEHRYAVEHEIPIYESVYDLPEAT